MPASRVDLIRLRCDISAFLHDLTPRVVFADVTERVRQEPSVPQAPCGGIGAPSVTVMPPSHAGYAENGSQPPNPRAQRGSTTPIACDSSVNARKFWDIPAIIRAQTARDFLAALEEWQRASGADRAYWRQYVRMHIREERARLAKSRAALHAAAARRDAA